MILDPLSYKYPALISRFLLQRSYQQVSPMLLPGFCSKTLETFITMWCLNFPKRVPLDLVFKDCAHLLLMAFILMDVVTNTLCDFAVILSMNPGNESMMLFYKVATDKNILENLVRILGGVVWDIIFNDLRKDPREWHKQ